MNRDTSLPSRIWTDKGIIKRGQKLEVFAWIKSMLINGVRVIHKRYHYIFFPSAEHRANVTKSFVHLTVSVQIK